MSPVVIGIIGLAILLALIFLRMPIALAFAISGFFGVCYFVGLKPGLTALGTIPFSSLNEYVWTTIPLFTLMGYLADESGMAQEFYAGIRRWIGHFRGGMATSVIMGNAAFGACSGSNISAAVTFTVMSLPEMRKYKYADSLSLGAIGAGSSLSVLIPPSIPFIILGAITQTSIAKLFIAGLIPGLVLTVLYLGVIYIVCQRNPALGPAGPRASWSERFGAAAGMWAFIAIFVIIIGGIYLGLFTPTEAGGVAVFVVLILGVARRKLSWQGFKTALIDTGITTGMIGLLLVGTIIFNLFLTLTGATTALGTLITGVTQSPVGVLLIISVIYIILGCFLDGMALTLLTVPIFFPIAVSVGVDPLLFGVLQVVVVSAGGLTPPVGIILYVMAGAAKDVSLFTIARGVTPFLIAVGILALLVIFIPQISLFLPGTMMG